MSTANTILPNWLARCAQNFPTHLALQSGSTRWSFAELDHQATQLALQLATAGVQVDSRVALLAANGLEYATCVHALMRLGAILVPLNTRLTLSELTWQIRDVQATLLLSDARHTELATSLTQSLPALAHAELLVESPANVVLRNIEATPTVLLNQIDLSMIQAIMYTSGTTGTPKGVIMTYGMQWWNAIGSALNLGHYPDDCWLLCMPLFHIGGIAILIRSVINGISVILHEKFDPLAVNRAICTEHVTIISVVAVTLQRMLSALDTDADYTHFPTTLRCVLLGGGPAPRPLLEDCASRAIPVVQTYGLTESCSQAVTLAPTDALRKLGSAGRPLFPVQLRIMNEDQPAKANEPGIICLKGPSITPGYDHRPEATALNIRDGWLSTGDIGYLDTEDYLYVLDRRSDLIISGGENIYPAEIEATLLAHPAIEEAAVCGQSDPHWGQVPIAFVCLRKDSTTTTAELLTYATQHLARYKLPRAIYLVDQLPRNSSGKLLRRELPHLLPPEM